jgi:hypothetical protein
MPREPDGPSTIGAALEILSRPMVWVGFALAFALLLGLLLALAAGGGAAGARFDYDLF